jgi:hypothetical protein
MYRIHIGKVNGWSLATPWEHFPDAARSRRYVRIGPKDLEAFASLALSLRLRRRSLLVRRGGVVHLSHRNRFDRAWIGGAVGADRRRTMATRISISVYSCNPPLSGRRLRRTGDTCS